MLTEAKARKLGWEVVRGSYYGTCDDRADRWYTQRIDARVVDRRGPGAPTKKAALASLEEYLHYLKEEEENAEA